MSHILNYKAYASKVQLTFKELHMNDAYAFNIPRDGCDWTQLRVSGGEVATKDTRDYHVSMRREFVSIKYMISKSTCRKSYLFEVLITDHNQFWEDMIPRVEVQPIYHLHSLRLPKGITESFKMSFIFKDEANRKSDLVNFGARRFEFPANTHEMLTAGKPVVGIDDGKSLVIIKTEAFMTFTYLSGKSDDNVSLTVRNEHLNGFLG